jgi:hypothetical protein
MSKSNWRFKRTELQRLFKALTSMGFTPSGVEVRADGTMKVVVAETGVDLPGCKRDIYDRRAIDSAITTRAAAALAATADPERVSG